MTNSSQTQDAKALEARLAAVQAQREQDLVRYGRAVRDLEWTRRELALREKEQREEQVKVEAAENNPEARVGLPVGWFMRSAALRAEDRHDASLAKGPLAGLWGALMLHFARRAARGQNYAQAEVFYQAALLFRPRPFLWRQLGNMQAAHGMFRQALVSFDRALADAPDDAEAWFVKGQALQSLDQAAEATAAFAEAERIDPAMKKRERD